MNAPRRNVQTRENPKPIEVPSAILAKIGRNISIIVMANRETVALLIKLNLLAK